MDKDGNVKISWEEWRDFLILQPNTQLLSIFHTWSHATVSSNNYIVLLSIFNGASFNGCYGNR